MDKPLDKVEKYLHNDIQEEAKNRIEILRTYIDDLLLNMSDVEERRCGYLHLYGVSQACALIAIKRNENVELATMAGMLHDLYSYKMMDTKDHAEKGAILAREILEGLKLTNEHETALICSAIKHHSSKQKVHSAFDEILKDADVMQHCLYNPLFKVMTHEEERYQKIKREFGL